MNFNASNITQYEQFEEAYVSRLEETSKDFLEDLELVYQEAGRVFTQHHVLMDLETMLFESYRDQQRWIEAAWYQQKRIDYVCAVSRGIRIKDAWMYEELGDLLSRCIKEGNSPPVDGFYRSAIARAYETAFNCLILLCGASHEYTLAAHIIRILTRAATLWTEIFLGLQANVDEINELSARYEIGLSTAFQSSPSEVAPIFRETYLAQIEERTRVHRQSIENEKDIKKLLANLGITINPTDDSDKILKKLRKLVKMFRRNQESVEREINGVFTLFGDPERHSSAILKLLKRVSFEFFKGKIAKLMAYKDIIEESTIHLPKFSDEVAEIAKKTVIFALQKSA